MCTCGVLAVYVFLQCTKGLHSSPNHPDHHLALLQQWLYRRSDTFITKCKVLTQAKISVVIHNLQLHRGVTKRGVVDDCGCSVP